MPFVKLDVGILDSTLWLEKDQRDLFITALLMAHPAEFEHPLEQLDVLTMEPTGYTFPAGWYGFVPASGVGIMGRAQIEKVSGTRALVQLCSPELESRSVDHEGRRMARVNGGYIVINYMKYREFDHGAADRMRKLRMKRRERSVTPVTANKRNVQNSSANVTEADSRKQIAEADKEQEQIPFTPSSAEADLANKKKKRSKKKSSLPTKTDIKDARHSMFKMAIWEYWKSKNTIDCPWGVPEGRTLDIWLTSCPNITIDQFRQMLRNRYRSNVNHADRPSLWISRMTSYANGPILNGGMNGKTNGFNGSRSKTAGNFDEAASLLRQLDYQEADMAGDGEAGLDLEGHLSPLRE